MLFFLFWRELKWEIKGEDLRKFSEATGAPKDGQGGNAERPRRGRKLFVMACPCFR